MGRQTVLDIQVVLKAQLKTLSIGWLCSESPFLLLLMAVAKELTNKKEAGNKRMEGMTHVPILCFKNRVPMDKGIHN